MIKVFALLPKTPDLSNDEFHRHWREVHAPHSAQKFHHQTLYSESSAAAALSRFSDRHAVCRGCRAVVCRLRGI